MPETQNGTNIDLAESPHCSLVCIPLGHNEKGKQVENTEDSQEEEEVVKVAIIQIVRYPPVLPTSATHIRHDGHKHRAQVISQGYRCERQCRAEAPHGIWRLLIEKFQLSDECEDFRTSYDEVLGNLPEDCQGNSLMVVVVVSFYYAQPHYLQDACSEHGENGYEEAYAHALELGDSISVSGELSGYWDNDPVIDGNPDYDTDGVKDGKGCRWDLEATNVGI